MKNKNNRITDLKHMGRKVGKQFFPVTITLSQAQIDYLRTKPNASGLIRKILDDLIASESQVEQKLSVVALNFQLGQLYEKLSSLQEERWHYLFEDVVRKWQTTEAEDPGYGIKHYIVWEDQANYIPKQLDTEDGKVAFRVLQGYDEAIKVLEEQISQMKQKILQG